MTEYERRFRDLSQSDRERYELIEQVFRVIEYVLVSAALVFAAHAIYVSMRAAGLL